MKLTKEEKITYEKTDRGYRLMALDMALQYSKPGENNKEIIARAKTFEEFILDGKISLPALAEVKSRPVIVLPLNKTESYPNDR